MVFAIIQLLSKSLNALSYFTQLPYHPSFSVLLKILKSHMISMHIVSFQENSIFDNSYIKCTERGVFRIEHMAFSRYYVVNLEKCEIVFKLLASNCMFSSVYVPSSIVLYFTNHCVGQLTVSDFCDISLLYLCGICCVTTSARKFIH